MMDPRIVGSAFDAGATEYRRWATRLWEPVAGATVAAVAPQPGELALDACCGYGASALPAARAVGPAGHVDAVDLAPRQIQAGQTRATAEGLPQIHFTVADILQWRPTRRYDFAQCVLGIFFLADMSAGLQHLICLLRPGGRLAVTVWERGAIEPIPAAARDAVLLERPDLTEQFARDKQVDPTAAINTAPAFQSWLANVGLQNVRVHRAPLQVAATPQDAWDLVIGTILRSILDPLDENARARVRDHFLESLTAQSFAGIDGTTLIGIGYRDV